MNRKFILLASFFLVQNFTFGQVAGTLDTSFGVNGKVTNANYYAQHIADMQLQSDGKIVTAGVAYTSSSATNDFKISRFNSDGTLDTSFGSNGLVKIDVSANGYHDGATALEIQSDGKIIVAGVANQTSSGSPILSIIRLNIDGTLDTSFGSGGKTSFNFSSSSGIYVKDLAIQSDGKIIIAGGANTGSTGNDFAVARLNANGILDDNFSNDGKMTKSFSTTDDNANSISILSDGKILIGGSSGTNDLSWMKLFPDGSIDTGFGTNGSVTFDPGVANYGSNTLTFLNDNYVLGATAISSDVKLYKISLNSGTLDTTFGVNGVATVDIDNSSFDESPEELKIDSSGGIYASGYTSTGGTSYFYLLNFTPNGILDTNFSYDGKVLVNFGGSVTQNTSLVIQSDGKPIVGGYYSSSSGSVDALARFSNHAYLSIVEAEYEKNEYSLYPNPASEFVYVSNLPDKTDKGTLKIFDAAGKLVKQAVIKSQNNRIEISSLQAGVYFVSFENGVTKKLIIK